MPNLTPAQLSKLVGNPDAYAVQKEDGSYYPVRERLSPQMLRRHLEGQITIGTYFVRPPDTCRTLVLDFDSGEAAGSEAEKARAALIELGVPERSTVVEFSGNKGYHVWVVSASYVPAVQMQRLGRAALAMAQVTGEVYPKQAKVRDLGNLVKLPEGVHRVTGKRNHLLGDFPQPCGFGVMTRVFEGLPQEAVRTRTSDGPPVLECMQAIQEGVEEGWRNHGLFHFATSARRAGLMDGPLLAALQAVNAEGKPPVGEEELTQIFESSRHSGPICSQLPEEMQCTDCPFRQTRLFAKVGQVAHGLDDELVVVQLGSREHGTVELKHPDISKGLVSLK